MIKPEFGVTPVAKQASLLSRLWRDHALFFILACLISVELFLVLLDITVNWQRWSESRAIRKIFNITREDGLASLFSVVQTLLVASVLWIIFALKRRMQLGWKATGWFILASFFTYMGIDDGAMIHERIGTAYKSANESQVMISYGWQMVIAPLFIMMGFFIFIFLWRQGADMIRRDWLFIGLSCLAVAMFIDFVEGMENGYVFLQAYFDWDIPTIRHFSKSLEEFLEMAGMSLLLIVFLNYLMAMSEGIKICFHKRKLHITILATDE